MLFWEKFAAIELLVREYENHNTDQKCVIYHFIVKCQFSPVVVFMILMECFGKVIHADAVVRYLCKVYTNHSCTIDATAAEVRNIFQGG